MSAEKTRYSTLELFKEAQKFSAGHFTIFSAEERENLHGHNFTLGLSITGPVGENGMFGDYRFYKKRIEEHCRRLNETFLLPAYSPYLKIEQKDGIVFCIFAEEHFQFLERDITILPVTNTTVEELSRYFAEQFASEEDILKSHGIISLRVWVSSGPGQRGDYTLKL